jgi:hypothetical protein
VLAGGIDIGTVISTGGQEFIATGGTTSNTTILSGGLATISGGGTLDLGAGATEAGSVVFAGIGGKLEIDGTVMPGTVISGFAIGDTIDLTSINSVSVTSVGIGAGNVLQVFRSSPAVASSTCSSILRIPSRGNWATPPMAAEAT